MKSTVRQFVESLGSRTATPGGGSASACVAAIGTSLATMVCLDEWFLIWMNHLFDG